MSLIDIKHRVEYLMYEDRNADWGYCKLQVIARQQDAFELVYVVNEGKLNRNVVKRYAYPFFYL